MNITFGLLYPLQRNRNNGRQSKPFRNHIIQNPGQEKKQRCRQETHGFNCRYGCIQKRSAQIGCIPTFYGLIEHQDISPAVRRRDEFFPDFPTVMVYNNLPHGEYFQCRQAKPSRKSLPNGSETSGKPLIIRNNRH